MEFMEHRHCPVCGACRHWRFGFVRHLFDGDNYIHVKFRNEHRNGQVHLMVSILKNGKRMSGLPNNATEIARQGKDQYGRT